MSDLIERQAAIDIVEGIDSYFVKYIEQLPPAEPEVKPIGYQDCSNALLKMWMENVLTDSEYYRIHKKLDASNLAKGEIRWMT